MLLQLILDQQQKIYLKRNIWYFIDLWVQQFFCQHIPNRFCYSTFCQRLDNSYQINKLIIDDNILQLLSQLPKMESELNLSLSIELIKQFQQKDNKNAGKLESVIKYLERIKKNLQLINKGQIHEIQANQCGQFKDIFLFYKTVFTGVNSYYKENILKEDTNKQQLESKTLFWETAKSLIDAQLKMTNFGSKRQPNGSNSSLQTQNTNQQTADQAIKTSESSQSSRQKVQQSQQRETELKNTLNEVSFNRCFNGELIDDEEDRSFIVDILRKLHSDRIIKKTKLIYSYPLMEVQNIHSSIDDVPNYIFVIQLQKCNDRGKPYMIAMYSERALKRKDQPNTGKGFVASVTNKKQFYLINNDPSAELTEYNDYYIVFGKGEIKLKRSSNILQLNIGCAFKSLDTGNLKNPHIFTGEDQEESKIVGYEVYQIIFQS